MSDLLTLDRVEAGYGPIQVLKGVSLRVGVGEIVALIGAALGYTTIKRRGQSG